MCGCKCLQAGAASNICGATFVNISIYVCMYVCNEFFKWYCR